MVNKILLLSPQETFGPLRKICVSDFIRISVDFKGTEHSSFVIFIWTSCSERMFTIRFPIMRMFDGFL